jgi:hypothetical protein
MKNKENAERPMSAIKQVQLRIRAAPCIRKISANRPQSPPKATRRSPYLNKAQFLALENSYLGSSAI